MGKILLNIYQQNQELIIELILFGRIFSMVLLGVVIRNIWDDEVALSTSKIIAGAIFLSFFIAFGQNYITGDLMNITAIATGFGAENLMEKMIKNKVWDKYFKNKKY